jgi:gliding motility-associated lipoprotein GldH
MCSESDKLSVNFLAQCFFINYFYQNFRLKRPFLILVFLCSLLTSCIPTLDVFERDILIPKQQWQSNFKPQIHFNIEDTASLYNIYLVIRHADAYNYNNIWIKASVQQPGDPVSRSQQYNVTLATNEKGWLGSGMDDIYEQRILIQPQTKFLKAGDYLFTLEQIMREDPLQHVFSAGLRIEKIK